MYYTVLRLWGNAPKKRAHKMISLYNGHTLIQKTIYKDRVIKGWVKAYALHREHNHAITMIIAYEN